MIYLIGFTRSEKRSVKVIDDDIYNRIIAFKAKKEIIIEQEAFTNCVHDYNRASNLHESGVTRTA